MGALGNALIFVVSTLFTLYIGAVMLRLILSLVRADFYNPLSQAIVTITNPAIRPLRRILPSAGRIDTAAIALVVGLAIVRTILIVLLAGMPIMPALIVYVSMKGLAETLVYLYIFCLIGEVILSWVSAAGGGYNPVAALLGSVNRPLLAPIRRVIPPIGMIDLSPLLALLFLNALLIVIHSL